MPQISKGSIVFRSLFVGTLFYSPSSPLSPSETPPAAGIQLYIPLTSGIQAPLGEYFWRDKYHFMEEMLEPAGITLDEFRRVQTLEMRETVQASIPKRQRVWG
jgi:hypothetical protein